MVDSTPIMASPATAIPTTATRYRWVICALLFWVTTANYIDRSVFGNLAPEMPKYLHLADKYYVDHADEIKQAHAAHANAATVDPKACPECQKAVNDAVASHWGEQYWNMTVVFSAAYALSMLVMGRLMDVMGLRWGFVFACAFWGIASMLHAFAPQIGAPFGGAIAGFFICRILLGFGEGGNFPAAIKTTAEWFPKSERALATGLFNSGSNIGGIVVPYALPVLLGITIGTFSLGWRGPFLVTAAIDLLWIIAWLKMYRKPEDHPNVNQAELAIIRADAAESAVKVPWRTLFGYKQTWAFAVGKGFTDCFWWFYLFGSPDFFARRFSLGPDDRKYMIMMIYAVASVGSVAGGWLAGSFMKNGWTTNKARKVTMLICGAAVIPVIFAAFTYNKWVAAILITLAASAHQAWSANVFSLAGDMFPRRVVGSVTGLGGMIGAVGGIILFAITGKVVSVTGNYEPIFILAGLAYVGALAIIHFLVPRLEMANVDAKAAAA